MVEQQWLAKDTFDEENTLWSKSGRVKNTEKEVITAKPWNKLLLLDNKQQGKAWQPGSTVTQLIRNHITCKGCFRWGKAIKIILLNPNIQNEANNSHQLDKQTLLSARVLTLPSEGLPQSQIWQNCWTPSKYLAKVTDYWKCKSLSEIYMPF